MRKLTERTPEMYNITTHPLYITVTSKSKLNLTYSPQYRAYSSNLKCQKEIRKTKNLEIKKLAINMLYSSKIGAHQLKITSHKAGKT